VRNLVDEQRQEDGYQAGEDDFLAPLGGVAGGRAAASHWHLH
jgi:hypothetical protein